MSIGIDEVTHCHNPVHYVVIEVLVWGSPLGDEVVLQCGQVMQHGHEEGLNGDLMHQHYMVALDVIPVNLWMSVDDIQELEFVSVQEVDTA